MVVSYDDWASSGSRTISSRRPTSVTTSLQRPKQMPDGTVRSRSPARQRSRDRFLLFPVAFASLGSNLKTTSIFFNDKWDQSALHLQPRRPL
jgi:hypothetical protein